MKNIVLNTKVFKMCWFAALVIFNFPMLAIGLDCKDYFKPTLSYQDAAYALSQGPFCSVNLVQKQAADLYKLSSLLLVEQKMPNLEKCIRESMSHPVAGRNYPICPSEESNRVPACATDSYVKNTFESFAQAFQCVLKDSPSITMKEMAALFNHESRFHSNVLSDSDCRGVGQLSTGAIVDMHKLKSGNMGIETLKKKPECAFLDPSVFDSKEYEDKVPVCDYAATDKTLKNFVTSMRYYRYHKESFETKFKGILVSKKFPKKTIDDLLNSLIRTCYNGGPSIVNKRGIPTSIAAKFGAFINTKDFNASRFAGDVASQLWNEFRNAKLKIGSEPYKYVDKMKEDSELFKLGGKSCF